MYSVGWFSVLTQDPSHICYLCEAHLMLESIDAGSKLTNCKNVCILSDPIVMQFNLLWYEIIWGIFEFPKLNCDLYLYTIIKCCYYMSWQCNDMCSFQQILANKYVHIHQIKTDIFQHICIRQGAKNI